MTTFLENQQELLWLIVVVLDLSSAILLYRLFGRYGLYAVVVFSLMFANIQGPRLTVIFGLQTSMGVILYSSIYFATDLLGEKYGRGEAQRAVIVGFCVSVLMVIMAQLSLLFQPAMLPETHEHAQRVYDAMQVLFSYTPRFVIGSLLAYLISQSLDVWIFHRIKQITAGRHLWLRNTLSTLLSQMVDTAIYSLVVWWGIVDLGTAIQLALAKYLFKFCIAVIDTPFIYLARSWRHHHH